MQSTSPQTAHDFFETLRQREAQAAQFGSRHLVPVPDADSMLYWLAEAAREARKAAGRKQVHIAASTRTGVDQSTITRFEKRHGGWPRNPDATIQAYADDLDVSPRDLWRKALELWDDYAAMSADQRAGWIVRREAERNPARRPRARKGQPAARRGSKDR